MQNTEETVKQQTEFDYMVRDAFSVIKVKVRFSSLIVFNGEGIFTKLPKAEIVGEYNILGSAAKFDGVYYLEDGVWQRDGITALFDAKPTVASWTHKIDGTHTYDTSILKHIENAISTYWNDDVLKQIEIEAIKIQCSVIKIEIAATLEQLRKSESKLESLEAKLKTYND